LSFKTFDFSLSSVSVCTLFPFFLSFCLFAQSSHSVSLFGHGSRSIFPSVCSLFYTLLLLRHCLFAHSSKCIFFCFFHFHIHYFFGQILFKIPLSSPSLISISFCFFLFALFIRSFHSLSLCISTIFFISLCLFSLFFLLFVRTHLFTSIAYLIEPKHPLPLFFHVLSFEIAFRQNDWLHNQTNLVSFQILTCDDLLSVTIRFKLEVFCQRIFSSFLWNFLCLFNYSFQQMFQLFVYFNWILVG
jgi:hypothetical protein